MGSPSTLSYFGSFFTAMTTIYFLFDLLEKNTSDDVKLDLSEKLKKIKTYEGLNNWAETFGKAFDKIFGKEFITWEKFIKSSIASYVCLLICFTYSYSLNSIYYINLFETYGYFTIFFFLFVFGAWFNLVPDYICLNKTRYLIKLCEKPLTKGEKVGILLGDIISTYIIFFFSIIFPTIIFVLLKAIGVIEIALLYLSDSFGNFEPPDIPLSVFLATTYFASIWFYLYLISSRLISCWQFFESFMNKKRNTPFTDLGIISILIVFVIYLIAAPFVLFK